MRTEYKTIKPYLTKDGSTIRELMHPDSHGNRQQSLAEARVPTNTTTSLHLHKNSEEIYFILQGEGEMTLEHETFAVKTGDTILIPPNTAHKIRNSGEIELQFLCACSPAYSHEDTYLLT